MTPQYPDNPKKAAATALSQSHSDARDVVAQFVTNESGSVTVDWTVLSGVAVSLALGTAGVMSDVTGMLSNNMGNELRDRDLSATAMDLDNDHFAPLVNAGLLSAADAQALYDAANGQMNNHILTQLDAGITALEAGTLTPEEMAELIAIASVAYQRNLVPDAALDHYFGFDSGEAPYMEAIDDGGACNQGNGNGNGMGCINGGGNGNGNNGNGNGGGLNLNVNANVGGANANVNAGVDPNGNVTAGATGTGPCNQGNGNGNGQGCLDGIGGANANASAQMN